MSKQMSKARSVEEFRTWVLEAYRPLIESKGFVELPPHEEEWRNPFAVRLGNPSLVIEVEGTGYGESADMQVFRIQASVLCECTHPLWSLINTRRPVQPKLRRGQGGGQRQEVFRHAAIVMEYASDILSGDVAALDEAIEAERRVEEERKVARPSREQRAADAAASEAGYAFKRGEYSVAANLLEPHLDLLPSSQRKRYEIARQRAGDA